MGPIEFRDVLERHPWLADGLADHADEVLRIAERIIVMEVEPVVSPVLPADGPEWERRYWARRAERVVALARGASL